MNVSSFAFEQTWIPFTQGCFVPNLVEIGQAVLEKKIFEFRQCIFAIWLLSYPGKERAHHLNKFEWCILLSLVEIDTVVQEKKIFKFCQFFSVFGNYLPLEKGGVLYLNKLVSPFPNNAFFKFVWNWGSGYEEEY